jgi:CRISPR-associated endonuclease Csn1
MNKNIVALNNGKGHQPILKVRTYEPKGNKFNVGSSGNKRYKYVEAAKGTNLFFAIYADAEGNRTYETIPLNIVIERLKQGLKEVPEKNEKGHSLLFCLSPNDLVYVPAEDEMMEGVVVSIGDIRRERIYKMVSCTERECHFVPNSIAYPILKNTELGSNNKAEKTWDGIMIKQVCRKLNINRLGGII